MREYIAQYNETDFNFFSRLLEQVGVFYTFVQQDAQALLLIQDDSTGLASLTLPGLTNSAALIYMPVSGQLEDEETVYLLQKFMHYFPRKDKRHDYNFRTAKQAEDEQLARLQQQVIDCQRSLYVAETNCRGISAGSTLSMSGHPQKGNNGDYLVVVVRQQGDQAQAFVFDDSRIAVSSFKTQQNPKRYHNELILLKKDIPYRPPLDYDLIPEIRGVYRARIATPGSECAYLDESGRYRLKKPVDTTDTQEGEACHAANEMQDSAGSHFTLHAGTVVRLSCRGGDPDWPVIWA